MGTVEQVPLESRRLLEAAGYEWKPDRDTWVNHGLGQAISLGAVVSRGPGGVREWILEGD